MKKMLLLVLLASLFILSILPGVSADEVQRQVWLPSETTKTITVSDTNPQYYSYTPIESGEYALKALSDSPLSWEFRCSDDSYVAWSNWSDTEGNNYDIYQLTAGVEYWITFVFDGSVDGSGGIHSEAVSIIPWDNSILIPDYPSIQENEQVTVTLAKDEYAYYLFSPSVTGTYCIGQNYSNIHVGLSPVPQAPNQDAHFPEDLGTWNTDTQQGTLHRLEAGNIYLVCVSVFTNPSGSAAVTDTIWIRQGDAPQNDYESWQPGDTKTVTLNKNNTKKYYFTPTESGKYMMLTRSDILVQVLSPTDHIDIGTDFQTSDGVSGFVYELTAGQQYTVILTEWASETGTATGSFTFQKVGAAKSASIYVANFSKEHYMLGLDTDPVCGITEGVSWSVSDPSVFELIPAPNGAELRILKKGQATVTVKVGNATAQITLTSEPALPILIEGQTLNLTIGGTAAVFTPSQSGSYQFTIVPNRPMLINIFDNKENSQYFKENFTDTQIVTLQLKAGIEYQIVQLFGRCSVRVVCISRDPVESESTDTTQPTQSTTASTQPSNNPTEPLQGTEPSVTEGTDPSESTGDMTPEPSTGDDSGMIITDKEMSEAIGNVSGNVISFSLEGTWNRRFEISSDALQLAADKGCALSLDFLADVNVYLSEEIMKNLSGLTAGEDIAISVVPHSFGALNESQQKAMEGWGLGWLLDIDLTVDSKNIHELGGKATISFPNPDTSEEWTVLYLAEDGTVEEMDISCDENITFSTDHFSFYALVWKQSEPAPIEDNGPNGWIAIPIILVVLAGGGTAAFFILKKKGLIPFKK